MKKLSVSIMALLAFTACHTNGSDDNVKASGGSISAEQDHADFQEMMKERSRYNSLFNSVKGDIADVWEDILDIFGDYVIEDPHTRELLSADISNSFSFGGGENDMELYY